MSDPPPAELQKHIDQLFTAELQFRLASAVRIATTQHEQPLDLPLEWTHGKHRVRYAEVALRQEQAEYAAVFLQRSSTYLMAVAVKDAIRAAESDPKNSPKPDVRAAYQIARLIRNAFAHAPFAPTWSIDDDCRDIVFAVPDTIELNTAGLHGKPFDWQQYGGPLALFRLCRFVRINVLGDKRPSRKVIPKPQNAIFQQGDLILKKVSEIPPGAVLAEVPDDQGRLDLGGGYVLHTRPAPKE